MGRRRRRHAWNFSAPSQSAGEQERPAAGTFKTREYRDWAEYLAAVDSDACCIYQWEPDRIGYVRTLEDLRTLAHRGWPEGAEHVKSLALPVVESVVSRRVAAGGWAWDVTGAAYDLGEYLSGAPECWLTPAQDESKPVIRIQVDLGLRASIPGRMVTLRGAGVVALTLALQAAGYIVDVAAICGSGTYVGGQNVGFWLRVPLVDANGGPIDTDRLLFALAHPAMVRCGMFSLGADLVGRRHGEATRPEGVNPWSADLSLARIQEHEADWQDAASVSRWVQRTFDQLTKGRN